MATDEQTQRPPRSQARFPATQWSVVLTAGQAGSPEAFGALNALCEAYRDPVYAWFRQRGHPAADADDLTQRFFVRIVERRPLERFQRQGVPFRVFLKHCLRNLAINHGPRGPELVPLEDPGVETEIGPDPGAAKPEAAFDEGWRKTVLAAALESLRREAHQRDDETRFRVLAPLLAGVDKADMEAAAAALGVTRNHANQLLFRLRQRYREFILEEVARTVPDGADPNAELRSLFAPTAS